MADPSLLPDIIRTLRDEYAARGIDAYAIGNGHCYDFAETVFERWAGEDWELRQGEEVGFEQVETSDLLVWEDGCSIGWDWPLLEGRWSTRPPSDVDPEVMRVLAEIEPGHAWIAVGRRHYDVDHPEGVDTPFELTFFRRWIENVGRRLQEAKD